MLLLMMQLDWMNIPLCLLHLLPHALFSKYRKSVFSLNLISHSLG